MPAKITKATACKRLAFHIPAIPAALSSGASSAVWGHEQGPVFNPKEGFIERAGPYHSRPFLLESQSDSSNEWRVLGDEDKASFERGFLAISSTLSRVILRKQESSHRHGKPN
jgi:hypothetical protein